MANACTNVKKRRTRAGLSFQLYTFFTWTNFRAHFRKSHLKSLKLKTLGKGFVSRCTRSFFFFLKKKTSAITVYTPLGSHPSRVFFILLSSFAAIEQTPRQMTLLYTIHHSGFSLWIHFAPSWKFHIAANALFGWVSTIHKTCHQVVKICTMGW